MRYITPLQAGAPLMRFTILPNAYVVPRGFAKDALVLSLVFDMSYAEAWELLYGEEPSKEESK